MCADWRVFPEVSPSPACPDFPWAFAGLLLVFSVRWQPHRPGTRAILSPGRQGVREERQTGSGCREAFSQLPSSRHWLVGTEAAGPVMCAVREGSAPLVNHISSWATPGSVMLLDLQMHSEFFTRQQF